MISFSMTDVGKQRKVNQDYAFCTQEQVGSLPNLFIVADGMGGHNAGDYASRRCVESVVTYVKKSRNVTPIAILEGAIQFANTTLRKEAKGNSDLKGMGTTLVIATIIDCKLIVANIGDSRLYVINDEIKQITRDHSLVEAMIESGELDKVTAKSHPNKNIITRAIGASTKVRADYFEVDLKTEDSILLCSDGLSNMLDDEEIKSIVTNDSFDVEQAGKALVHKANEHGGSDNIGIIIIKL